MPLRFNTDRSLYEAFPTARAHVDVEADDTDPTVLALRLARQGKLAEAASLCAYMLARRDAVAWGCRSLRALHGDPRGFETPGLLAAEAWVRQPDDATRAAAGAAGTRGGVDDPATWVARAAAWSGGSLGGKVPMPAHLTAVAVRIALVLAMRRLPPAERLSRGRACIEDAVRLAGGEERR